MTDLKVHEDRAEYTLRHGDGTVESAAAPWIVGCEGTASVVRDRLGIPFEGRRRTGLQVVQGNARPTWTLGERPGRGHIFLAPHRSLLVFPLPGGGFRFFCFRDDPDPALTAAPTVDELRDLVADTTRIPGLRLETTEPLWLNRARFGDRVAARLRRGRVLLAGDAAHTLSPSGGLGLATGVGDAADLGWKLAAELAGWAGPGLLDAYESERRPVAVACLEESHRNLRRTVDRRLSGALCDATPEGERERAALGREIAASDPGREFTVPDAHFAYRYTSPVIADEKTERTGGEDSGPGGEPWWNRTALPGARAPHVPLGPGRSTLDLFGPGFVLLCLGPGPYAAPAPGPGAPDGLVRAFAERRVPLGVVRCRDEEVARRYERPFVLVRPDGHVAWRGTAPPADPGRLADLVRGAGA
ncbi:FAD-dependent monooxygenase [Streptomyces vietnamensis]|uniref:FAD-dependent monooxygenase n=1 Tax=Streptomyces vietnamensis TaxID=362257 RepID=UPI000696BAE1